MKTLLFIAMGSCFPWILFSTASAADSTIPVSFHDMKNGKWEIRIGDHSFATFVYQDPTILRPYFCNIHAPGGIQITRHFPPIPGKDRTDHADMHPGLWLAFGDISGNDFWRNKARVEFCGFLSSPQGGKRGSFTFKNRYLSQKNQVICMETCTVVITSWQNGYLMHYQSVFLSDKGDFYWGDQEEMGLGVRLATPVTVQNGGRIMNRAGQLNEKGTWGKQAEWCDYSGQIQNKWAGIMIIPFASNVRTSWFHTRDYGLMVANPFGQNAFIKGEKSKIIIKKGTPFHLGYSLFFHSSPSQDSIDLQTLFLNYKALSTIEKGIPESKQ